MLDFQHRDVTPPTILWKYRWIYIHDSVEKAQLLIAQISKYVSILFFVLCFRTIIHLTSDMSGNFFILCYFEIKKQSDR